MNSCAETHFSVALKCIFCIHVTFELIQEQSNFCKSNMSLVHFPKRLNWLYKCSKGPPANEEPGRRAEKSAKPAFGHVPGLHFFFL